MFSIALSVLVFHALALLGLLAAFALDNAQRVEPRVAQHAGAQSAFEPTDEQILTMVAAPAALQSQTRSESGSSAARAA
jgi:hypothetical protein